jgi:hypothetical protein
MHVAPYSYIYSSHFTKRTTHVLLYLETDKMENHVTCVKTKLETLIVNVVCHDKMHMLAKFGIFSLSMLVFCAWRKCSNICALEGFYAECMM